MSEKVGRASDRIWAEAEANNRRHDQTTDPDWKILDFPQKPETHRPTVRIEEVARESSHQGLVGTAQIVGEVFREAGGSFENYAGMMDHTHGNGHGVIDLLDPETYATQLSCSVSHGVRSSNLA